MWRCTSAGMLKLMQAGTLGCKLLSPNQLSPPCNRNSVVRLIYELSTASALQITDSLCSEYLHLGSSEQARLGATANHPPVSASRPFRLHPSLIPSLPLPPCRDFPFGCRGRPFPFATTHHGHRAATDESLRITNDTYPAMPRALLRSARPDAAHGDRGPARPVLPLL